METYSFRPAAINDIDAVHRLIAEQNILDFGDALRTVEDIKRNWNSPNFDLKLDSLLAITPGDEIAGYAELKDREDVFVYLSHQHQNGQLAVRLLNFLEKRANSQKTDSNPGELWGRAGHRNRVLIEALEASGYKTDISFLVMEIKLTEEATVSTWPENVTVRKFIRNQDERVTYETDEDAGRDKGYHNPLSYEGWAKRMGMDRPSFNPDIWFLACEKDEVAGAALNIIAEGGDTGWVDHLSVRRPWRNKGIGKALLLHSFAEFFKRGIRTVKLSVDSKSLTSAPRLYESVGMKTVQKYHIYKKAI